MWFPQVLTHLEMRGTSDRRHYVAAAQDYELEIPFCGQSSILNPRLLHFEFVPVLHAIARLALFLFMHSLYHCS